MTLFFAQSDGFNLTLSSRNWFARYWQPINSLGYRDVEPRAPRPGEKFVLVVGDSFVAGHGKKLRPLPSSLEAFLCLKPQMASAANPLGMPKAPPSPHWALVSRCIDAVAKG